MQAECILKQRLEIEVKEKQVLKNLLTQEQIIDIENGALSMLSSSGEKLKLDDDASGIVLLLTPLCGG